MEKVELSKRLKKVASFVKEDEIILDIGSDHAYLPIYLVQEGKVSKAIAGEVVAGPFAKAQEEIHRYDLSDHISTRLASGFDVIESNEEMGTVFICGMGGLLISEILEAGLKGDKIGPGTRLVLQPNNKEIDLRKLLMRANYKIIDEAMIKENEKFYEIIVAEKSEHKIGYTVEELTFGPYLMREQSAEFKEKWQGIYQNNQKIMKQLDQEEHKEKRMTLKAINEKIEKVVK